MKKETFKQVMKSGVGPKLVPFFKTLTIYFVLFIPSDQSSYFAAIIKALPVISLIVFILLHGMSLGSKHSYSRRIVLGLSFSVLGDVLLIWKHFFLHGLIAFLIAQIFYISAFGHFPLNWKIGSLLFGIMAIGLSVLMPVVSGPFFVGVLVYSIVLITMLWRAIGRSECIQQFYSSWSKFFSAIGGVLFVISDTALGFNHFYTPLPHAQALVMSTYYAAQFAITLSVIDFDSSVAVDTAEPQIKASVELTAQKSEEKELKFENIKQASGEVVC